MAHKPAFDAESLSNLGTDKLVELIADEVKRNVAFRKIVSAALTATKGPKAIAAVIDKRLAGLDRAKGFVDWEKAKMFAADLSNLVSIIVSELGSADPDAAIDRLIRFLFTSDRVFERIDDSRGRIQSVYHDAASAIPALVAKLDEGLKASLSGRLLPLAIADDYGFFAAIAAEVVALLPPSAIDDWDARFVEAVGALGPIDTGDRNWERRAKADRIARLRQVVADHRGDVDAFMKLEISRPGGRPDTMAIAERLLNAGRLEEALEWVRKSKRRDAPSVSEEDFLDDPDAYGKLGPTRLEVKILEAKGDRATAQDLRWLTFEATLDTDLLRDYVRRLQDFEEFDVLDRAFAHAKQFSQNYLALAFFLEWPRFDLAAQMVLDRRADWDGRYYGLLLPAAQALEPNHPAAATILYRALLEDILDGARSPAYGHAARYLAKLDALATDMVTETLLIPHDDFRTALTKKHGRKSSFWSLVKARK